MPASRLPASLLRLAGLLLACGLVAACQNTYFNALEKIGIEKRKVLADRLEAVRGSQEKAEEAYVDALTAFRSVVDFDGGDLERTYNRMKGKLDSATSRADALSERIDKVESVAKALFDEWDRELSEYQDASLRARSRETLQRTRSRYKEVEAALHRAEASFKPALATLHDQVLYLKHNLNAAALGSLKAELPRIEADAERLRRDLQAANAEAERFLKEFEAG
ncbi:MAG: DUF2959 family protein [Lysobacteraceae bacterium]